MDDLISRQEAMDRLSEVLSSEEEFEKAKQVIIEAPTAYNVDKVVEQLEVRKTLAESIQEKAMDHAMFGGVKYMQPIVETIEEDLKIVKTGGGTE